MASPYKIDAATPRRYKPVAPTRSRVVDLRKQGLGATAIGNELGISRARVYQHIARARQLGELPAA